MKNTRKSKKREERDESDDDEYSSENYNEMDLQELQKLLKKRGLKRANDRRTAILFLKSNDKGIVLSVPKTTKLQQFEPSIKPLETTTLYTDEARPFYGVPMSVLSQHLFKYLKYPEKLALARTCRNFYSPLMKNICITFHLFLKKLYLDLGYKVGWYWRTSRIPSLKTKIEKIIETGLGITPLAVAYYCKSLAGGNLLPSMTDIDFSWMFSIICNYGSLDNYIETQRIEKIQFAEQVVHMRERLIILNQAVQKLGYEAGRGPFRLKGKVAISLWCNKKALKPSDDGTLEIFYDYVKKGIEFDWSRLDDYLSDISDHLTTIKKVIDAPKQSQKFSIYGQDTYF